ncbi:MAG TPA: glucose 1-dehydrogenase [Terriglobales bacterium]|nr:glucose 1-dehydrogenase [Terriglobales bacterium]
MSDGVKLSLDGRVALVTGGSRGIGAATVRMFVKAGAKVVFNYQKARDRAEKLVFELGSDRCHAVQMDLSSAESAEKMVTAVVERFGRLDAAVLNHGIWPADDIPVDEMSYEHWHRTISINLDSTFGLVKSVVAQMKKQKSGGHLVIISSTAGQRGEAFHVDYAATKGAVISMVKGLSTELAKDGIYVNCVAPGWVNTEMAAPAVAQKEKFEKSLRLIPVGRIGKPEEIAAPVLFLCTEHAGFITGEIFNVNGGAVLVG